MCFQAFSISLQLLDCMRINNENTLEILNLSLEAPGRDLIKIEALEA